MLTLHIFRQAPKIGIMKKLLCIFSSFLIVCFGTNCFASEVPVRDGDTDCSAVEVVFARGSGGEYENTREYFELKEASEDIHRVYGHTVHFSDLDYPAVDMSSPLRLLGAVVSAGRAYDYWRSVRRGATELKVYYLNTRLRCPETKWILVGYSQGATVVTEAVKIFNADAVLHLMLFGDPETYLPEGEGLFPDACQRLNYSAWRRYVPECRTAHGVFGARQPYEADELENKYSLWCERDDYICGSSWNPFRNSGHTQYVNYMKKDFRKMLAWFMEKVQDLPPGSPLATLSSVRLTNSPVARLEYFDDKIRVSWDIDNVSKRYLLLRLNGVDLGYVESSAGKIEINDIDWGEENNISLLAMDEDGELGEEIVSEVENERSEASPEIVLSPVEPQIIESPPESGLTPEEPKVEKRDGAEETENVTREESPEANFNNDSIAQLPQDRQTEDSAAEHVGTNMARILPKNGFNLIRPADVLKIGFAALTAVAVLVIFWVKKK